MIKRLELPTVERINELFRYVDGKLVRKVATGSRGGVGTVVGTFSLGYVRTKIDGRHVMVHRLIYKMHHGYLPDNIDHINGNTADNRIENLRPATVSENQYNSKTRADNSTGVKGVSLRNGKWCARTTVEGKRTHLGYFDTLEEATLVIKGARLALHKEFTNHGEDTL